MSSCVLLQIYAVIATGNSHSTVRLPRPWPPSPPPSFSLSFFHIGLSLIHRDAPIPVKKKRVGELIRQRQWVCRFLADEFIFHRQ